MGIINILKYLLWASFSIQIFHILYFYSRILFKNSKSNGKLNEAVSIIISAKNEAENLKKFLPKILNQNYLKFELVIINDGSNDDTLNVIKSFAEKYKNITIVNINESLGKKNAITKGIEASKYEYLLFTDADCYPVSKNWISKIMQTFNNNTEIVLAYGAYEKQKTFLNKLIRFETLFIAIKYMSYSLAGIPYMGVGRNLSYKKTSFIKNGGFNSHKNILSGDDDLLVQEIANKKNTSIIIDKESYTKSIPKKTWKDYFIQKRRHLTTGVKYSFLHKFLFATDEVAKLIFYISFLLLLFFKVFGFELIIIYFIRMFLLIFISCFVSNSFKEPINLFFFPIFDVLIPIIALTALISNLFNKTNTWK